MKHSVQHKGLIVHYYINIRKIVRGIHNNTELNNMIKQCFVYCKILFKKRKII